MVIRIEYETTWGQTIVVFADTTLEAEELLDTIDRFGYTLIDVCSYVVE